MLWRKYPPTEDRTGWDEGRCINHKKPFWVDREGEWVLETGAVGEDKAHNEMWAVGDKRKLFEVGQRGFKIEVKISIIDIDKFNTQKQITELDHRKPK